MDFDKNTNHTLIIIFYFKKKKKGGLNGYKQVQDNGGLNCN